MNSIHIIVQRRIKSLQRVLLGVGLITLAIGCAEGTEELPLPPPPEVDEVRDYLSFELNTGNKTLSSRGDLHEFYEGTIEERYVKDVRLVLYDGPTGTSKVENVIDYKIQTSETGANKWKGEDVAPTTDQTNGSCFVTIGKRVKVKKTGNYYALAIINATNEMKTATQVGASFDNFQKAREAKAEELSLKRNFPMTNCNGLVKVEAGDLKTTSDQAHSGPIKIAVERMVAKVILKLPAGKAAIPCRVEGATATSLTWGLDITNKWTYWLRKGTETANSDRETWYAQDPNYSSQGTTTEAERLKQFNYYVTSGKTPANFPKSLANSNNSVYCLENTMASTEQKKNQVITRVLIRCTYKPNNTLKVGESFFVMGGIAYTPTDMKDLQRIAKEEEATNNIQGPSRDMLEVLALGYDFSGVDAPKRNGSRIYESFDTGKIKYYYKGINYYAIKVLHLGTDDKKIPDSHGYFGVLRNTQYTVELTEILGPGSINLEAADLATRSIRDIDNGLYNNIKATINHIQ